MKNNSFKQFLKSLPPLKIVENDSSKRLPSYFDMMWDMKYESDLFSVGNSAPTPETLAALAKHGYDAQRFAHDIKNRKKICCDVPMQDITTQEIATR